MHGNAMPVPDRFTGLGPDGGSRSHGQSPAHSAFSGWIHALGLADHHRDAITGLVLVAGVIGMAATPVQAACLGGPQPDNNCRDFIRFTDSFVEVGAFADSNLSSNRWFRIGFSSTQAGPPQPIQAIEFSYDNGLIWHPYGSGVASAVAPIQTLLNGPAVDKGSPIGSDQFRYRFTLPGGVFDEGTLIRTSVSFDDTLTGLEQAPQTVLSRQFRSDDPPDRSAPGPLPAMGAAMSLVWSRRLRRRLRSGSRLSS